MGIEARILPSVVNGPGERKRLGMTNVGGASARWRVAGARFSGRAPMRGVPSVEMSLAGLSFTTAVSIACEA